jgi:hypothetical protein
MPLERSARYWLTTFYDGKNGRVPPKICTRRSVLAQPPERGVHRGAGWETLYIAVYVVQGFSLRSVSGPLVLAVPFVWKMRKMRTIQTAAPIATRHRDGIGGPGLKLAAGGKFLRDHGPDR